jgi:hypothetical protein
MHSLLLSSVLAASAAVAACYTGASVAPDNANGNGSGSGNGTATDTTSPVVGDLPCDVAAIVASDCATCHGATPSGGAPNRLVTHDDFAAPSKADPSQTEGQVSVARMKDASRPMPPSGPLAAGDIMTFENWVNAGMPKGTCAAGSSGSGGSSGANTAAVCTSGQTWAGREGRGMDPGQACIACHSRDPGAPVFTIAGTVYATAHEPDMCLGGTGSAAGASVVVTDANGASYTIAVGASGNFSLSTSIPLPYKAKVLGAGGGVRTMAAAQTNGDCNVCHTENGASGAPGRVFAP